MFTPQGGPATLRISANLLDPKRSPVDSNPSDHQDVVDGELTDTHKEFSLSLIDWFLFRLIDLSGALRYEGVELDSCLLKERPRGALLPDDHDVEPTSDPAQLPVVPPIHLSALTPGPLMVINVNYYLVMTDTFLTISYCQSMNFHCG